MKTFPLEPEEDEQREIEVGKAEYSVLPPVRVSLHSTHQTHTLHMTWKEASDMNRKLTAYLTKNAIRN